jgi:GNAT superfamily N-acetyltransferase
MEVRVATPDDAEWIAEVHIASIRAAYRDVFPPAALAAIDLRERAERWWQVLAEGETTTLLGESSGEAVGFANFGASRDGDAGPGQVGEVMAIYVRPTAWGTGAGGRLLREALERLREPGYREATLWVLEGNRRAIGFYERFGFARDGALKSREMYGVPVTLGRLRRELSGRLT